MYWKWAGKTQGVAVECNEGDEPGVRIPAMHLSFLVRQIKFQARTTSLQCAPLDLAPDVLAEEVRVYRYLVKSILSDALF